MQMLHLDESVTGGRRTAHEYVRQTLRLAILGGAVAGGTRLVQADLAAELGVSTTPVREALRDLATEGLIDLDAHRGAIVKKLDYDELVEIHDLIRVLESEAMKLAAKAERKVWLERAERLIEEMETETDVGRWVDLNRQFHESLVEGIGNKRLQGVLEALRDAAAPYIGAALQHQDYRFDRAQQHHRKLVELIRAGNGERAARVAEEHVDLTTWALQGARHLFE
jgi:DNA-binding GntR family transcriptional regulator